MNKKSATFSHEAQGQKGSSDKRNVLLILIWLVCDAAIIVLSLFFLLCLLYFINGSLEISPTQEDHEKVRTVMAALMLMSGILCIACIAVRVRCRKKRKNKKEKQLQKKRTVTN